VHLGRSRGQGRNCWLARPQGGATRKLGQGELDHGGCRGQSRAALARGMGAMSSPWPCRGARPGDFSRGDSPRGNGTSYWPLDLAMAARRGKERDRDFTGREGGRRLWTSRR
jgi:hypothetical protein